jgi:uncharacterized membrane protein
LGTVTHLLGLNSEEFISLLGLIEMYEAVFHLLGLFCHQLPERSFFIFGAQFPLCIRCSALLAGGLGALVYVFIRFPLPSVKLCITMTLPMVFEIAAASAGLVESAHLIRGVNGFLFGFFFLMGSMVWLARSGRGAKGLRKNQFAFSDVEAPVWQGARRS